MSNTGQPHHSPDGLSMHEEIVPELIQSISNGAPTAASEHQKNDDPAINVAPGFHSEHPAHETLPLLGKRGRKFRTRAEKAYDQARKEYEKTAQAVQVALLNLQAEKREATYQAGIKMIHSMLLQTNQSVREGALSVLLGMADDTAQPVLQEYLDALNSAPLKTD